MSVPDFVAHEFTCATCKTTAMGETAGSRLHVPPPRWIVADTFPPGDTGPAFLCSPVCAETWLRKEEASWER